MHLSLSLFSFVVVTQTVTILGHNSNKGAIFFPDDEQGKNIYSNGRHSVKLAPSELEPKRGTNKQFVNEIITTGISRMTLTINRQLTNQPSSNNVVFSPVSIAGVLALVLLGANGATFNEISQFMGLAAGIPDINKKSQIVHEQFSSLFNQLVAKSRPDALVNFATAVFVQKGFPIRPLYKSTAEKLYKSDISNMDFQGNPAAAQKQVNRWVDQHTHGKIKTILDNKPSSDTKVILASALYFKAEWEKHFSSSTNKRPFFINGRDSKSVHEVMMMSNGGEFPYYKDSELGCEILGLPYKDKKSTMYIILPSDSNQDRLHRFEARLTESDLERLVLNTRKTEVSISFPKMRIESTIKLTKTLEALGVKSLFIPGIANLALLSPGSQQGRVNSTEDKVKTLDNKRQMINEQSSDKNYQNPGLYASQVLHKVYVDITETGTEAAAVTSVELSTRIGSDVDFIVDVPFLFFIRHEETKTILLWGSVVLPSPSY